MMQYKVRQGYMVNIGPQRYLGPGEVFVPSRDILKDQRHKIEPVRSLPEILRDGAWAGRRCFILGGGPSLKTVDLSFLEGELTIGVNRAFELMDPTVILSMDTRFYDWIMQDRIGVKKGETKLKFLASKALKVWVLDDHRPFAPEVLQLRLDKDGPTRSIKDGIFCGANSGLGAISLAILLGASPIYLLGFDMHSSGEIQKWWHDGYPCNSKDDVYHRFRFEIEKAAPVFAEMGARIINLNPGSAVKCFEFGDLAAIPLVEKNTVPPVVTAKPPGRPAPTYVSAPKDINVTVITPTGDRPEALALLRSWISEQTLKPAQWIIVDDGQDPLGPVPEALVLRRKPRATDPPHTLAPNLATALPHVKHGKILIMEDDDYYGPAYIETMAGLLDHYDLVGESHARYYHLPAMKFWQNENKNHASLGQTGFRASLLPFFEKSLTGEPFIDLRFWKAVQGNKHLIDGDQNGKRLHCGIKGLPGRKGIGSGHNPDAAYYQEDRGYETLISWIGQEAAQAYLDLGSEPKAKVKAAAMSSKVTISILCHNKMEVTKACIESLLKNQNREFELLIADNGSKDGTWKYLQGIKDKRVKIVKQANIGFIAGHNQHLQIATGDYFIALNNDITAGENWLDQLLEGFDSPQVKIVGPFAAKLSDKGTGIPCKENFDFIEGACLAIPTGFAREIGLFSESLDFMYSEDADLSLRVRAMGYRIKRVDCDLIHLRNVTAKDTPEVDIRGLNVKNNSLLVQKWATYMKTRNFVEEIFIHRRGAQGDVLLLTPLLAQMKRENVHRSIYLSTICPQLLQGNPAIAGIMDKSKKPNAPWIDLDLAYENHPEMHIVDAYAQALGLPVPKDRRPLVHMNGVNLSLKAPYIVFHAGPCQWPGRQLPFDTLNRVVKVLKKRGQRCFEIGPRHNLPDAEAAYINAPWETSVALIRGCNGFIGIDSSPMHVAHAFKKPGAVAFGCINSKTRLANQEELRPVMVDLACKFCHHWQSKPRTFSDCLRGTPECMTRITPEQILEEFDKAIGGNP